MSGVRFDSVADLPAWAQKQLLGKVTGRDPSTRLRLAQDDRAGEGKARNKYNAKKTEVNGIRFDSKKEARRYEQLMLLLQAGKIRELKLQRDYTLQEAYTDVNGTRWRAIRFRADFSYEEQDEHGAWVEIVEDVKSKATKTRVYAIKKKLMQDIHGVRVREFE